MFSKEFSKRFRGKFVHMGHELVDFAGEFRTLDCLADLSSPEV